MSRKGVGGATVRREKDWIGEGLAATVSTLAFAHGDMEALEFRGEGLKAGSLAGATVVI